MLGVRVRERLSRQRQMANVRVREHVKCEVRVLHSINANNDTLKVLLIAA